MNLDDISLYVYLVIILSQASRVLYSTFLPFFGEDDSGKSSLSYSKLKSTRFCLYSFHFEGTEILDIDVDLDEIYCSHQLII